MDFEKWLIEQIYRDDEVGLLARDYHFSLNGLIRDPFSSTASYSLEQSMAKYDVCEESLAASLTARLEYELLDK